MGIIKMLDKTKKIYTILNLLMIFNIQHQKPMHKRKIVMRAL